MKLIPKYEYYLVQVKRHSYYSIELAQDLSDLVGASAIDGWQVEGPHQLIMVEATNELIISQMMKRYHPEFLKQEELEGELIYSTEQLKNLPVVVQ